MTLVDHIAHLRTLAQLDPETTVLQMAMINVMEELAEAVDGLRGRFSDDQPPDDHLGSI
jgi:hypothetical protein